MDQSVTLSRPEVFEGITAARGRVAKFAKNTPVLSSRLLDAQLNCSVFFKCENLQCTGAFKIRGASNSISLLSEEEKKRGVLTYSSGNHAQGIARTCQLMNIHACIVMPNNAPPTKIAAVRETYGAEVVLYDPVVISREDLAAQLRTEHGYTLIPPYDYLPVVCGQGTACCELMESVSATLGEEGKDGSGLLDVVMTPLGGGGLLSGTAVAAKHLSGGRCKVYGVEPTVANDGYLSFNDKDGKIHSNYQPDTIADGTRTTSVGKVNMPIIRAYCDGIVTVSEQAIKEATVWFFKYMKMVVEPSGALPLAALLSGVFKPEPGSRVGIIISGGNVSPATLQQCFDAVEHPESSSST